MTSAQAAEPHVPLLVEVVRVAGEKPLFVAGLWRIEAEKADANGCEPSWQKREELLEQAPEDPSAQPKK